MLFVLPSSNLEHVVVPEPSRVWVPFCYLSRHSTESVGSCKMCNLVIFKPFIIERILFSRLSFFFLLMSWLFVRFSSSFYKNRVLDPPLLHG